MSSGRRGKSLKKRFAEKGSFDDDDESCINRAKKKRSSSRLDDCNDGGEDLSLGQLSSGNFWF